MKIEHVVIKFNFKIAMLQAQLNLCVDNTTDAGSNYFLIELAHEYEHELVTKIAKLRTDLAGLEIAMIKF